MRISPMRPSRPQAPQRAPKVSRASDKVIERKAELTPEDEVRLREKEEKRDPILGMKLDRTNDILMGVGLAGLIASKLLPPPFNLVALGVTTFCVAAALWR